MAISSTTLTIETNELKKYNHCKPTTTSITTTMEVNSACLPISSCQHICQDHFDRTENKERKLWRCSLLTLVVLIFVLTFALNLCHYHYGIGLYYASVDECEQQPLSPLERRDLVIYKTDRLLRSAIKPDVNCDNKPDQKYNHCCQQ